MRTLRTQKAIWIFEDQKIYARNVEQKLREIGITDGDIVMVHADTRVFGKIGEIRSRKNFYTTILDSMVSVVGDSGALIVPAYTYSLCKNQVFDVRYAKPTIGGLSEIAVERYQKYITHNTGQPVIRSNDPIFSCVGFGGGAHLVLENQSNICFGDRSVFGKLYRANAKLMCFGFEFAVTYMHYVERCYDRKHSIRYRYDKDFTGKVVDWDGKEREVTYKYFVRDLRYCEYDLETIPRELKKRGLLQEVTLGGGQITLSTARELYNTIFEMLESDKYGLLNAASKYALTTQYERQ